MEDCIKKCDIGLVGLGVMGQNLALNIERNGYRVGVYDRESYVIDKYIGKSCNKKNIIPMYSLEDMIKSLTSPRKILIMIKAGYPVDIVIDALLPYLDEGDIVIDGGNSYFEDTRRRVNKVHEKGVLYMGAGVSGGEEGALNGPSIMPGGDVEAWESCGLILKDISAKVEGIPCCEYIGSDGAGHFVKMVHNGIEYADMQLIAESYHLLRELGGMSCQEISSLYREWNDGVLESYLIEITADILSVVDEKTGKPMVDVILDTAGQKGTGEWTSQQALELGVSTPTVTEAVFARCISAIKDERIVAADILSGSEYKYNGDKNELANNVMKALYASKIVSYAQGFALLKAASNEYNWDLNLGEISMLWRDGCIIRARFLSRIRDAYNRNPNLLNLMLDDYFKEALVDAQQGWKKVVVDSVLSGIPAPSFASAIAYYDSYRSKTLPANLIQAQRDYFGAHTYERVDEKRGEFFHTQWLK